MTKFNLQGVGLAATVYADLAFESLMIGLVMQAEPTGPQSRNALIYADR